MQHSDCLGICFAAQDQANRQCREEQEKMAEPYINHAQRRLCQSKQKRINKPHGTLLAGNLGPLIASHESRRQGHSLMQEAE